MPTGHRPSSPAVRSRVLALVAALAAASPGGGPCTAVAEVLEDSYAAVMINGHKAGYLHSTTRLEEGQVTTDLRMQLALSRGAVPLQVNVASQFHEDAKGKPLAFRSRLQMAANPMLTEGRIVEGNLHLKHTVGEVTNQTTVPFDPQALFPYGVQRAVEAHGMAPATR